MSLYPKKIATMTIQEIEDIIRAQASKEIRRLRPIKAKSLKRKELPIQGELILPNKLCQ